MNEPHTLEHHNYDLLLGHKDPMALRLNDATHKNIQVGDLVKFSGHDDIMDRQRFQVVSKMAHPTIHEAVSSLDHASLSVRDKIQMKSSFLGVHGPESAHHEVVSLHLTPHTLSPSLNRSVGHL